MPTVNVEVPNYVKKSIGKKSISFIELYNKMEKENWIDENLEKPMEMQEFYNFLKKEL